MDREIERGIYGLMKMLEQQSKSYVFLQHIIVGLLVLLLIIAINIWNNYPYDNYNNKR
jgi:hypothetical protein